MRKHPDSGQPSLRSVSQILESLMDMEIILQEEQEYDATLANGTPKHWHVFDVIARKVG